MLGILLLSLTSEVVAITGEVLIQNRHYTTEEGLPTNLVKAVHQTRDGYVWLATDAGIVRFDGYRFDTYGLSDGLPNLFVKALLERRNGTLVAATDGGVVRMTTVSGQVRFVPVLPPLSDPDRVLHYPKGLYEDVRGNLWISGEQGVGRLSPDGRLQLYRFPEEAHTDSFIHSFLFAETSSGTLILSSEQGFLYRYEAAGDRFVRLSGIPERPFLLINAMLALQDGTVLVAGETSVFALQLDVRGRASLQVRFGGFAAQALLPDGQGGVYLSVNGSGIFHSSQGQVNPVPVLELTAASMNRMAPNRENGLWIAADNGLHILHQPPFAPFWEGANHGVELMTEGRMGGVYLVAGSRLLHVEPGTMNLSRAEEVLQAQRLSAVEGYGGNLWVGTRDGTVQQIRPRLRPSVTLPSRNHVATMESLTGEDLWVVQHGVPGISRVDAEGVIRHYGNASGVYGQVNVLRRIEGTLYAGAQGHGSFLLRYDPGSDTFENLSNALPFIPEGLFEVEDLASDGAGGLWLGSNHGLFHRQGGMMHEAKGLEGMRERVRALARDASGNLWVGTDRQLLRYHTGDIARFGRADGLLNLTTSYRSIVVDGVGRPWVASIGGVSYGVSVVGVPRQTPRPLITSHNLPEDHRLSHRGYLSVDFRAFSYPAERVLYQSRLAGRETWSAPSMRNDFVLPSLDAGVHALEVRAQAPGERWSEPAQLHFRVLRPAHLMPLAFAVYALGLCAVGMLVFNLLRATRERRRAQADLQRYAADLEIARDRAEQAAHAKGAFLASMSHEIRTPLNGVIGMTSLLLDTPLQPSQQEYAEIIRSSGDNLLRLINDILDYSKIEAERIELELRPVGVRELIEKAFDLIAVAAMERGLELILDVRPDVPLAVIADETRVRQVILNLLSNAVKFTDRGEVLVRVQTCEAGLCFEVRDTGIGIAPDRMESLFNAFTQADASTTRKYGGTGLGLAISRRLAELMGGTLTASSVPGEGATFQFAIPVVQTEPSEAQRAEVQLLEGCGGRRALIVDDNATSLQALSSLLEGWALDVYATSDPEEALQIIREDASFDVALIDQHLSGMDGVELARALRALRPETELPLFLLSPIGHCADAPGVVSGSLPKPTKSRQIAQALYEALQPRSDSERAGSCSTDMNTFSSLRVLVAEDNLINQKVIGRMLERLGYQADIVPNGLELVRAIEARVYDVALVDVQMPEMDGLQAARHLKMQPDLACPYLIALTANALSGDRERCLEAGMDDYLSKPIGLETLREKLASFTPGIIQAA